MTFTSYNNSIRYNTPSSVEWLRKRDTMTIEAHMQNNRNQFSFNYSPERKHTKKCNGADELAFGDSGRCTGSL
jgi:hypothetical protein